MDVRGFAGTSQSPFEFAVYIQLMRFMSFSVDAERDGSVARYRRKNVL